MAAGSDPMMAHLAPRDVLAILNSISVNELGRVDADLARAETALGDMGESELGARVAEARRSLKAGDVREFRRAVANVTARLGHLK